MKSTENTVDPNAEEVAAPAAAPSLSAFFAQNAKKVDNTFIVASERFLDPLTSDPMKWEVQCVTAKVNVDTRKACTRNVPVAGRKGQFTQDFDANAYLASISVKCTVFPNLHDAALQQSYGVNGAEQLIQTMLTPAEFEDYSTAILKVNGFKDSEEMVEEAKN